MKKKVQPVGLTPTEFNQLPKAEQAIRIAKDVILQLKTGGVYKAKTGSGYVRIKGIYELDGGEGAREAMLEGKLHCTVCARGALFISMVKFKNKLSIDQLEYSSFCSPDSGGTRFLSKLFSRAEQGMIEYFFEGSPVGLGGDVGPETRKELIQYRKDILCQRREKKSPYKIADYLLLEIARNLVRNKGRFVIPKKYTACKTTSKRPSLSR